MWGKVAQRPTAERKRGINKKNVMCTPCTTCQICLSSLFWKRGRMVYIKREMLGKKSIFSLCLACFLRGQPQRGKEKKLSDPERRRRRRRHFSPLPPTRDCLDFHPHFSTPFLLLLQLTSIMAKPPPLSLSFSFRQMKFRREKEMGIPLEKVLFPYVSTYSTYKP